MGEGLARVITIGSIVLTVVSLSVAVLFARKVSRVRVGFDTARAAVGVGAILAMAAIAHVVTPLFAIVLAIAGGLALGFTQGTSLQVTSGDRGFSARRSPIGIALWGAGIVIMQAAGIASRTGIVKLGQTIAWFSVCLGIGLLIGRSGPLRDARQALAGAGAALLFAALTLPAVAFVGGVAAPAAAQPIQLTDEDVCDLIPPYEGASTDVEWYEPGTAFEALGDANCIYGVLPSDEHNLRISIALYSSIDAARNQFAVPVSDEFAPGGVGPATPLDFGDAATHWAWFQPDELTGGANLSATKVVLGPFLVHVSGNGPGLDTIAVAREVTASIAEVIPAAVAPPEPPPVEDAQADEPATTSSINEPVIVSPSQDADGDPETDDTAAAPIGDDEPIEPEDAAGQAIAGLIAAAAIGLISWAEASTGIAQILAGTREDGIPPSESDESAATVQRKDPCGFQQDKYEGALGDWQRIQSQIDALESEYAAMDIRIEAERAGDFSGAVFEVGVLGLDIATAKTVTPGALSAMTAAAKQTFVRSITKQLVQAAASGKPPYGVGIVAKAGVDAAGVDAMLDGNPTGGAFGAWFGQSITDLLAANQSYDYLKFMDTLAEPGAIADPETIRLIEKSSRETFVARIGPWVGVVAKYVDFYHKNKAWGEGVERRNKMRDELVRIRTEIGSLEYDLSYAADARDSYLRMLSRCREEMG